MPWFLPQSVLNAIFHRFDTIDANSYNRDYYLNQRLDKLMASVADLTAELATLQTDVGTFISGVSTEVSGLSAQIAALQAQIAAGGTITAAMLDPLAASVKSIDAAVIAATPKLAP